MQATERIRQVSKESLGAGAVLRLYLLKDDENQLAWKSLNLRSNIGVSMPRTYTIASKGKNQARVGFVFI